MNATLSSASPFFPFEFTFYFVVQLLLCCKLNALATCSQHVTHRRQLLLLPNQNRKPCKATSALSAKQIKLLQAKIKFKKVKKLQHKHTCTLRLAFKHSTYIHRKMSLKEQILSSQLLQDEFYLSPSSVCSKRLPIRRQLVNTLPKSIFIGMCGCLSVCPSVCLSACLSSYSALPYTVLRIGFLPSVRAANHSFIHSFIHSSVSHIRVPLVCLPHIRRCVGATSRVSALFFRTLSPQPNRTCYFLAVCRLLRSVS